MESKQILKHLEKEIFIKGSGKTKNEALTKAVTGLRKQVYKEIDGIILRMEPLEVYVLNEEKKTDIEKFLFFFMPREKVQYFMEFKIKVEISFVSNFE